MALRLLRATSAKLLPSPQRLPLASAWGCKPGSHLGRGVSAAGSMQQESFQSAREVETWLQRYGIDTSAYGKGSAKPVELLWIEVQEGETTLAVAEDGAPLRRVSVLNVLVTSPAAPGRTLYEAQQVLPSGVRRSRDLPLSEKLLPGEGWREAVGRAVSEELGPALPPGPLGDPVVDEGSYSSEVETKESQSYPGLRSQYVCHRVSAEVAGLPGGDFITREDRADGVLQHCWVWR